MPLIQHSSPKVAAQSHEMKGLPDILSIGTDQEKWVLYSLQLQFKHCGKGRLSICNEKPFILRYLLFIVY
jgi:hypothetical protein